jgi:hypothetical protein
MSDGVSGIAPATIASFTARARRVVTSLGFTHQTRFHASKDGVIYDVILRAEGLSSVA